MQANQLRLIRQDTREIVEGKNAFKYLYELFRYHYQNEAEETPPTCPREHYAFLLVMKDHPEVQNYLGTFVHTLLCLLRIGGRHA